MSYDIPPLELRINGVLNNKSPPELEEKLDEFYDATGIERHECFLTAIFLAQDPTAFDGDERDDDRTLSHKQRNALHLDREKTKEPSDEQRRLLPTIQGNSANKWHHLPWPLWKLVILCAVGAAIQGWDEAAVNGAQVWYQAAFNISIYASSKDGGAEEHNYILGLVNSAPYLGCSISCWFTPWLNHKLGRRGTIFWCAIFSLAFALAQGFAQSWQQLLTFRLLLGLGMGPKSATIPIYAAECAPANIRGSLVMFWQLWTAFGIMAGSIAGVVLQGLGDLTKSVALGDTNTPVTCPQGDFVKLRSWQCSQNWRLVIGSPAVLPLVLAAYIYGCQESPRWSVAKAHALRLEGRKRKAQTYYRRAFRALQDLSRDRLLASRDMLLHYFLLEVEHRELILREDKHPSRPWLFHQFGELFFDRRNGRAILASSICMFAQQFCGINFIIYYSTVIFGSSVGSSAQNPVHDTREALLYSMGFGIINLVFGIPAFFTIDTVGRRTLLLSTFPLLAICHVITAIGIWANSRAVELVGMSVFTACYSFGEGPVPFVYASESLPLHIREKGMAFVVSINWFWNWFIAFTGPEFMSKFSKGGTFVWYAGWCVVLFFLILLLVPETRCLTLESLDYVFREKSIQEFARHAWKSLLWRLHIISDGPGRLYEEPEEPESLHRQPSLLLSRSVEPKRDETSETETMVEHKEEITEMKETKEVTKKQEKGKQKHK